MDRVILVERSGETVSAEVLDFKTDAVNPGDDDAIRVRVEHHAPQLSTYRRAVAEIFRLELYDVTATVIFLEAGAVVKLDA